MTEERRHSASFGLFVRELLRSGTCFRFCARGRSMLPTIQDGDTLYVEPIQKSPRLGDIVLFFRDGQFKAHRIVGGRGSHFVTRGDAGVETDGVVRRGEILGQVVAKENAHDARLHYFGKQTRLHFFVTQARRFAARGLRRWLAAGDNLSPISFCRKAQR